MTDRPVFVRSYDRIRNGSLEHVTRHRRRKRRWQKKPPTI